MKLPREIPGLRWATVLFATYAIVWIALEGNLARVKIMGWGVTLLLVGYVWQGWLAGRFIGLVVWLALSAALGTLAGFAGAIFTLLFMAVKTGLHAHGPEFDVEQIDWVVGQIPWWTSAGLMVGIGLGLIYAVIRKS